MSPGESACAYARCPATRESAAHTSEELAANASSVVRVARSGRGGRAWAAAAGPRRTRIALPATLARTVTPRARCDAGAPS